MKFLVKTVFFAFAIAVSVLFSITAFAESDENNESITVDENGNAEFTGEFPMQEFSDYYVDKTVKITDESFCVPKTSVLTVKSGGDLQVYVGGALDIEGVLIIEQGARVTVSGEFRAYEKAKIKCLGEFVSTKKSSVLLAGEFLNDKSSTVVFGGKTNLYKPCLYQNQGRTTFGADAYATVSGNYHVSATGELFIKGTFNTTLNAKVLTDGFVMLTGKLYNTGEITYSENAVTKLGGQFITGKSGRLIDKRADNSDSAENESSEHGAKYLKGIDVSYWQGAIDWKKVRDAGVEFAFLRSSLGDYYTDETFYYNITQAQKVGIKVGVYHFCRADTVESARAEAKFFLEALKPYKPDFPIVVDIEDSRQENLSVSELTRIADVFCKEVKKAGYTPMIYASASWLNNKLDTKQLSEYEIWVAHWGAVRPAFRGDYGVWQYSCEGMVSGISGKVDLNIAYKDYSKNAE